MSDEPEDLSHPVDRHPVDRHVVDRHVGGRARPRRKRLARSQEHLADAPGLTFQQVQTYERGANRISASKLYEIAAVLEVPVTFLFEGLGETASDDAGARRGQAARGGAVLASAEGPDWARAASAIRSQPLRRKVLELALILAEDDA